MKFKKSSYVNEVRFLKGLEYFLNGYNQNQSEIIEFIEYCQAFENKEGYLTHAFFKTISIKNGKLNATKEKGKWYIVINKEELPSPVSSDDNQDNTIPLLNQQVERL